MVRNERQKLAGKGLLARRPESTVATQSHDDVKVQLNDDDVPEAVAPQARPIRGARLEPRPKRTRAPKGSRVGNEQQPLYARTETMDLIRAVAHREGVSAQTLYREGLMRVLHARGLLLNRQSADDM